MSVEETSKEQLLTNLKPTESLLFGTETEQEVKKKKEYMKEQYEKMKLNE